MRSTCQNPPAPWLASWDVLSGTQPRLRADLSERTQALPRGMLMSWSLSQCYCCLVAKSCPTFCDPMDCSPPGASVHGISQVRILEWVIIFFSGDLPDPGIKPMSPTSPARQADSLLLSHQRSPYSKEASLVGRVSTILMQHVRTCVQKGPSYGRNELGAPL